MESFKDQYLLYFEATRVWFLVGALVKGCAKRFVNPFALVLPAFKEVSAPEEQFSGHEGERAYNTDLGSENFGGGGYESGQSIQVQGGDTNLYDNADVDGDEVPRHMQNEMENEDTDGYSAEGDDSDESDGEENADDVPISAG